MKKLLATIVIALVCVGLPMMLIQADPGAGGDSGSNSTSDSTTVDSQYGSPPPGYEGIWPPPDGWFTTTSDTDTGGVMPPFEDPDQ